MGAIHLAGSCGLRRSADCTRPIGEDAPMCPVDVKPDGTSSSGGRTEVKISSTFSVTVTVLVL